MNPRDLVDNFLSHVGFDHANRRYALIKRHVSPSFASSLSCRNGRARRPVGHPFSISIPPMSCYLTGQLIIRRVKRRVSERCARLPPTSYVPSVQTSASSLSSMDAYPRDWRPRMVCSSSADAESLRVISAELPNRAKIPLRCRYGLHGGAGPYDLSSLRTSSR